MSLPKRDGVHNRYYLIHKPDTSPEVLAEADLCIQDVLNGTARENHSAYPTVVRNHNGTPFLPSQLYNVCHREGFSRAGNTQKGLALIAFLETFDQSLDCLRLVAGGLVFRY